MAAMRRVAPTRRSMSDGFDKQTGIIVFVSLAAAVLFAVVIFYIIRSLKNPQTAEAHGRKPREWLQTIKSKFTPRHGRRHALLPTTEVQNASVDRHTSVRSIATLPAYSAVPREGEGVIGREGDREGMDTVLEFPETADEEETRREQEMDSLWRIRQQRRDEAAEREARRQRRQEARDRGDLDTLAALRHESMLRATYRQNNGSQALIAEHNSQPRERRVSAVKYADLGIARHDGTRVRANSANSDNQPLLDDAGVTGMTNVRPWMSRETLSTHRRMSSVTSLASSMASFDEAPISHRDGNGPEAISLQETRSRAQSRAGSESLGLSRLSTLMTATDSDLGNSRIPHPDPPQYDTMGFEDAPPYEGESRTMSSEQTLPATTAPAPPQLPAISRLPSIHITESSPIELPYLGRIDLSSATAPTTIHEEAN